MIRQLTALVLIASLAATPVAVARHHTGVNYHKYRLHGDHIKYNKTLGALTPNLRVKVSEILGACHSRLISGYRPGARVAGSGRPSLHSLWPSKAADVSGNPGCIYAHLHGWRGGYSTDYSNPRIRHVHISWSPPGSGYLAGREWHARFVHYGSHRYARRHQHRYLVLWQRHASDVPSTLTGS